MALLGGSERSGRRKTMRRDTRIGRKIRYKMKEGKERERKKVVASSTTGINKEETSNDMIFMRLDLEGERKR